MESLQRKLADCDQGHLLGFWDQLSEEERDQLRQDVSELNLAEATLYYQKAMRASSCSRKDTLDDKVSPIPEESIASARTSGEEQLRIYEKLGLQEIADGRVAVLLMAGGQGTRLGVSYPKGMYDVGLPSGRTLFQLQAERILRLQDMAEKECGRRGEITWYVCVFNRFRYSWVLNEIRVVAFHRCFRYILTSEATHDTTLDFLKEHNYFDLKEENVKAFKQGMLPCFTFEGKIMLDEKHKVSKAPDGNGGLYRALKLQGIMADMVQRGIRSVHAHSVDNILIKVADPVFLGYCLSSDTDCGVKVIEKSSPNEAVGVVCKVRSHTHCDNL